MGYQSIVYIASGESGVDRAALDRLCRSFVDAADKLHLLYIGSHHVTGFGSVTARHHIANDMQVKQEMFPLLKRLCVERGISTDRIHIEIGDPALTIERYTRDHNIDLLVISAASQAGNAGLVKLLTRLLGIYHCDLHIMR